MAAAHVRTRVTKEGARFDVRYRLGGRGSRLLHAGTFASLAEAERARAHVADRIARADISLVTLDDRRVYVARLGNLVKIGISVDPVARCRILNAELLLTLSGGREREREMHERFAEHRERGEWFRPGAELLAWISECLSPNKAAS